MGHQTLLLTEYLLSLSQREESDKHTFLSIVFIRGANEKFQSDFFLLSLEIKHIIFIIGKMTTRRIHFLAAQMFGEDEENTSDAAKQSLAANRPDSTSLRTWQEGSKCHPFPGPHFYLFVCL